MLKVIEKIIKRGVYGLIFLYASAILLFFIDVKIPINIVTVVIVFLLGWPAVILISLFALATTLIL